MTGPMHRIEREFQDQHYGVLTEQISIQRSKAKTKRLSRASLRSIHSLQSWTLALLIILISSIFLIFTLRELACFVPKLSRKLAFSLNSRKEGRNIGSRCNIRGHGP